MPIPLLDLKAQYASLQAELNEALLRVAASQYFILGPEVSRLERQMEEYLEVRHALGVSSGTDALLLAMMALGIGPGDEVIVPTFSFFATAGTVSRLGARPVFVDIDPVTFSIEAEAIERAASPRTRGVVPVHLFGESADMAPILDIAERLGIAVIEDAAQSIGARYRDGRATGSLGSVGCFSFFPSKNLGAFGDAGMVTTHDDDLYERMKIMRVHGGERRYYHAVIGGNFRLDEIQAAVLSVKLPHLSGWSQARQENAMLYRRYFTEAGLVDSEGRGDQIVLPSLAWASSGVEHPHIFNQFVVRLRNRDVVRALLAERGIGNEIYYPVPFHLQECFKELGYERGDFPHAELASEEVLALPIYPELSPGEIASVVDAVAQGITRVGAELG